MQPDVTDVFDIKKSYQDRPIIDSLLDIDQYKFSMGKVVYHNYRDVPVKFAFRNRTKGIRLADVIDEKELRAELDHAGSLSLRKNERSYLEGLKDSTGRPLFNDPSYLDFLENLRLPPYNLEKVDGNYNLEFPGKWSEVTYWETMALSIVNELYYRGLMKNMNEHERDEIYATGIARLNKKIDTLKLLPHIIFSDFGTRRRFAKFWQDYVVRTMAEKLPKQFSGTSNVFLAMKYGLQPIGTFAHEMYMALSGIMHSSDDEIRSSHNRVLQDWWNEYGYGLSIALTDNYGTDFFFRDMTPEQAREWKGLRHDSGDPFEFGEKAIEFYKRCGVDPREKLIVFSDGLDVETIVKLADYFANRIKVTFGWGTNLTNDLGFKALSLIVKLMESNGHGTVKLSDNLAKALGNPEDVERFKRIFGYTGTNYKEVKY